MSGFWVWFTVICLLTGGATVVFAMIGRHLWRKARTLSRELARAGQLMNDLSSSRIGD